MRGALLLTLAGCASAPTGPDLVEMQAPAPRFRAPLLDRSATFDLEEAIGSWEAVVLSFGASWCQPCLFEWPVLKRVESEYRDRGLLVVFVMLDQDPDRLEELRRFFDERLPIDFPIVFDRHGELARRYRVDRLPQLYLIDADGRAVWREVGYKASSIETLTHRLDRMLSDKS